MPWSAPMPMLPAVGRTLGRRWLAGEVGTNVEARVRRDDDLLACGDSSRHQKRVGRDGSLDQRKSDRPELKMACRRSDATHLPTLMLDRRATHRKGLYRTIEVQEHEPCGRADEAVATGKGLLDAHT